jgi:hypothetical protein
VKRVLAILALLSLGVVMTAGCGKKDPTTDAAPVTSGGTPEPAANKTGAPTNSPGQDKPAVNPGGG